MTAQEHAIYSQGNLSIAEGRLRLERQSLPLANIQSVTDRRIRRPRRFSTEILIGSAVLMLLGVRYVHDRTGWPLILAGAGLAAWCVFFHSQKAHLIRLNLLLNQRISVFFSDPQDAEKFLAALRQAKGDQLQIIEK